MRLSHSHKRRSPRIVSSLFFLIALIQVPHAMSRPEIIREDMRYYSDDYFESGVVKDLVDEKNIEEVYQFYTYYEVIYDAKERVKIFKEYKRGKVILEEQYLYDDTGMTPGTITILIPGQAPEVIHAAKVN